VRPPRSTWFSRRARECPCKLQFYPNKRGRPKRLSIAALRGGDFEGLLAVLDPDLVVRADMAAGAPSEIRGAAAWAKGAIVYGHLAQLTRPALVNGAIGVVVAPRGRLVRALRFTIANDKITEIEVIGNPARLGELDVSIVD